MIAPAYQTPPLLDPFLSSVSLLRRSERSRLNESDASAASTIHRILLTPLRLLILLFVALSDREVHSIYGER